MNYIYGMKIESIIFDMDGLLIDSEPLWQEAGAETLAQYNIQLTHEQYITTTGLRTPEWIDYWFRFFNIQNANPNEAIQRIEDAALQKILERGSPMPGVYEVLDYYQQQSLKIAIASSSPSRMIKAVIDKLNISHYIQQFTSAETLPFGKPHPQVFIECAHTLQTPPQHCLVFEDSFNGMIAAKAAKMKCVVVPEPSSFDQLRWHAADAKLKSLQDVKLSTFNV